ncbi:MAG: ABC transporter ATP-binding protein [Bacteroidota bacterium]
MNSFLHILSYAWPHKKWAFLNAFFNILYVAFSLFSLTMIAPFLDLLFIKSDQDYASRLGSGPPDLALSMGSVIENLYYYLTLNIQQNGKANTLLFICVLTVIMFLLKNLCRYFAMFFLSPLRNHVIRDIRNRVFAKILRLPLSYFSEEKKGDILSRMSSDVHEIEWSVMATLEIIFRDPVAILLYLSTLFFISPALTLFVLVLFPIAGFVIARVGKSLKRTTTRSREQLGQLMSMMEEGISGAKIIASFTAAPEMEDKFSRQNNLLTGTMVRMYRKIDLSSPMSEVMGTLVLVMVMYTGGNLVLDHQSTLTASMFITYIAIFSQLIPPARALTTAYYNIQRGIASGDRIKSILDSPEVITEKPGAIQLKPLQNEITYKHVSFGYQRGDSGFAINDVSVTIPKGKTYALVGESGSGKSTFADLLARFHDCSHGDVLLDGVSVKDFTLSSLRGSIGIVSQDSFLFNDTIFKNILLGKPDATEEEVIAAAKIANAHDFIIEMAQGYHTSVGDRGGNLSGGQRQRINIARAVLKNPDILILDEATSALDASSEKLVQEALGRLLKNRTSLVIAHRLSTIIHADEILVLSKGKLVEKGTHAALLSLNGHYARLFELQSFRE